MVFTSLRLLPFSLTVITLATLCIINAGFWRWRDAFEMAFISAAVPISRVALSPALVVENTKLNAAMEPMYKYYLVQKKTKNSYPVWANLISAYSINHVRTV